MPLVKVQKRHTLTIPVSLRDRIEVGGQVEMTPTEDGGIKITPMQVIPERATERILKLAEEARRDRETGRNVSGPFKTADEAIDYLHKLIETAEDED